MSVALRKPADADLAALLRALAPYEAEHPRARVEAYRLEPYIVRIRITDPDLAGLGLVERHNLIWDYFEGLPAEVVCQLSLLVPVTPRERKTDGSSLAFDAEAPRSS
jgi:hypothetical protein